jgi:hypothetical protein
MKRQLHKIFGIVALALSIQASAQFAPGQILSAAQLNSALSTKTANAAAAITGGTITGLSSPIPLASGGTGATTATGATGQLQYLQGATGSSARSIPSKLQDTVSVLDFAGVDPSGSADSTAGIQNAINSFAVSNSLVQAGGVVYFPAGKYRTTAPLVLTGRSGVRLVGAGRLATTIVPSGNFTAIVDNATLSAVDTKVGVESMWVQCSGLAGSSAHGISFTYVNSGVIRDMFFTGCNHALDMYDEWQTVIDNVRVDGQGVQQNAIGLYAGAPTNAADTMPNNTLIVSNTSVQHVSQYAYRLVYFAGSKFTNDEGSDGVTAWYLCDAAYSLATQPCHFGHFSNILSDTTTGNSIVIKQGANTNPVSDVMFDNVWSGNSSGNAIVAQGLSYVTMNGMHIVATDTGMVIQNSTNVTAQVDIHNYNRNNNGSYAIVLDGTVNSSIRANTQTPSTVLGYNGITEINNSIGNQLWAGPAPCALGVAFGGASVGVTYGAQSCQYQIDGMKVSVQFYTALSAVGSSTGVATLTGLPITPGPASGFYYGGVSPIMGASGMASLTGAVLAEAAPGGTTANLYTQGATSTGVISNTNFTATSTLIGQLNYFKQ